MEVTGPSLNVTVWKITYKVIINNIRKYQAANNSQSSDIGRPKFAHVRWNPTVVGHDFRTIFLSKTFHSRDE